MSLTDTPSEIIGLVRRCNEGDEQAWEQFYARYVGMVSRVARRYSTHVSRDLEDIVQEAFVHIFNALKNYDTGRPLDPFVLEITRNVCIGCLRRDAAEKRGGGNPGRLSLDPHDTTDDEGAVVLSSNADNAETALMKAQEARLVR
ncbi:MAG: RNA polymerase sigma factor, partial [Desulfomonile sp.]|nr:RNA polymerase sigma factor [Desulfomonile sp.]